MPAFFEVVVWMRADVLRSFVGDADGQLPVALQHLIRPVEQELYTRVGTATPAMQTAARQILHCPRQGIAKRIYLEGKALELFGLMEYQVRPQKNGAMGIPAEGSVLTNLKHISYKLMRITLSEQGVLIPKQLLKVVREVEIRS